MQLSFLDATEPRLIELSRHGAPLERLNKVIDWQMFMPTLKQIDTKARKSNAGRTLTDRVLLFKILILKGISKNSKYRHSREGGNPGQMRSI